MLDAVVLGMLVLGFAAFVTTHVALSLALIFSHPPRWRGLVALVVPILAPFWGWKAGRRKTTLLWGASAMIYGVGTLIANLTP